MELSPTAAEAEPFSAGASLTLAERLVVVQRDLAIALAATSDMQAALSLLLDYALTIDELDCGGIYLADSLTGGLWLAVHRGLSEAFVAAVGILAGDSPHARLVHAGRPLYFAGPDVAEHDPPCEPEGIRAVAAVPLSDAGEVIACVNLGSHTRDEIPLLARQWIEGITMQFGGVIARIKAQQELAHRTRELESLANHVPDVIFRLDARLCYVFVNERMVETTGVDAADMVGQPCVMMGLSKEWSKACAEACLGLLAEAAPAEAQFDTEIAESGCCYQTNLVPEVNPEGRLVGILGTARNVTDRRQREDELRITAAHYSQLVENCPDAILVHDGERFLFVNSRAARLLGLESAEELIGADVWSCVSPAFLKLVRGRVGYLLRTPGATLPIIEQELVCRDGTPIPIEVSSLACMYNGRPAVQVIARDIRQRREEAAQLWRRRQSMAQAARVTLLGEMTSGLAHELNQPLSAILNYAEACRQRLLTGTYQHGVIAADLENITRQAERAANVIHGLRRLMGRESPSPEMAAVPELIGEALELAKLEADQQGIRIMLEVVEPLPLLRVDRVQIQQVVLNLVQNGIEAIKAAGASRREIAVRCRSIGSVVEIEVEDTGPGLDPVVQDRLFEPFVTTKPHGLGLGLVICQSIVEAHQGHLWHVRGSHGGAVFRFSLPVAGRTEEP